jgi:integrase/recombinase XerC
MTAQPMSGPTAAELDAARLLLARMGISPAELLQAAPSRPPAPTFAEYIPVVSAAVSAGTRRVYGSYWNRILDQWAGRRLDEPTPSDVARLAEHVRTHTIARRNARGGRSAAEHLIAALRCLYNHAVADGHLAEADNPARKVGKPRRLPSTRRAGRARAWPSRRRPVARQRRGSQATAGSACGPGTSRPEQSS